MIEWWLALINNSARKTLLKTSKLTLGQCIDICKSSQTLERQLNKINLEDVRFVKSWLSHQPKYACFKNIKCSRGDYQTVSSEINY